jgi:NitT/TauT family transport system substrate-binding protein
MAKSLAVTVLATFLAIACGGSSATSTSPNATTQRVSLTTSYSEVIPDELAPWGAADGKYFDKNNLDVTLTPIASVNGVAALLSGQVQLAQLGGSEVVNAAAQGADVVIVANLVPVYPYIFLASKDISTIQQLKGKKVGVSKFGGSADIATRVGLKKQGLDPAGDVTIVETGSAANRVAALRAGSIQGAVSQPPESTKLKADGYNILFDMAAQKLPATNTVLATTRTYIKDHRDVVQRYVDSLIQALARERKDQKFTIDVMRKWEKLDNSLELNDTYDFYVKEVFALLPYPKPEQYADAIAVLGAKDAKVKNYDINKLLDPSFVKSAADRKVDQKA